MSFKETWKNFKLNRIAWLQRQGALYFPFWDMVFKYPPLAVFNSVLRLKSRLTGSTIIHTIGDSHVAPYIYRFPFLVHHISQATAHNLCEEKSFSRSSYYLKHFLTGVDKSRDAVFLVFGEIDARAQIYLQYGRSGRTIGLDTLINNTVERYGRVIYRLRDEGYRVAVHGLPPASSKEFITALPFSGKPRERSEIFRIFNEKLGDFCRSAGVVYVDVQSVAADERGFFKKRYLADEVHCNSNIVSFARRTILSALKR